MAGKRKAHTLIELIVVVLILAALAFVAVPRFQYGALHRQRADTLARKIVTDLRHARVLAISNAATNTDGYALNMTGSAPYSGYEIVNLDTSTAIANGTFSIDSNISCTGGSSFEFGPLGSLTGSDTQLTVTAEGKTFTINIVSATGMVKCTEN